MKICAAIDGTVWALTAQQEVVRYLDNGVFVPLPTEATPTTSPISDLSVGIASNIWALDTQGWLYQWQDPLSIENAVLGWQPKFQYPNCKSISAGTDGSLWFVDGSNVPILYDGTQIITSKSAPTLNCISAVNQSLAYGVATNNTLYRRNGTTWYAVDNSLSFASVSIGGDSTVYAIDTSSKVYKRWNDNSWQPYSGALSQISVGKANFIFGIDTSNNIVQMQKSVDAWQQVSSGLNLKQISVCINGNIKGVTTANTILEYNGDNVWGYLNGNLDSISNISPNETWGTLNGFVYRLVNNYQQAGLVQSTFMNQNVQGAYTQVAVTPDMSVLLLSPSSTHTINNIYQESGKNSLHTIPETSSATSQNYIFKYFSAGSWESIWGILADGSVYLYENKAFTQKGSGMSTISAAADGTVYASDANGNVYLYDAESGTFGQITGNFVAISAGSKDHVWALDANGNAFQKGGIVWDIVPFNQYSYQYGSENLSIVPTSGRSIRMDSISDIPLLNAENLAIALTNINNLNDLILEFQVDFQSIINVCYNLFQIQDNNPRQTVAEVVLKVGLGALKVADIPGAALIGTLVEGLYNSAVNDDIGQDLNAVFANVWACFQANLNELKDELASIKTAFLTAQTHTPNYTTADASAWTMMYTSPESNDRIPACSLAVMTVPIKDTTDFRTLLMAWETGSEYELYKNVLLSQYSKGKPSSWSGGQEFKNQNDCNTFMICWCNENPWFRLQSYSRTSEDNCSNDTVLALKYWFIGGSSSTGGMYGSHPSAALCQKLFKDNGIGTIVNSAAITTRQDVFTNWYSSSYSYSGQNPMEYYYPGYSSCIGAFSSKMVAAAKPSITEERIKGRDFSNLNMKGANLANVDTPAFNLQNTNLSEADLSGANFSRTNLNKSDLSKTQLQNAFLNYATLKGADLSDINAENLRAWGIDASSANLSGATLNGAILRGANLKNADLSNANLKNADLTGANLTNANLTGADLTGANLRSASMEGANTTNAKMVNTNTVFATGLPTTINFSEKTDRSMIQNYDPKLVNKMGIVGVSHELAKAVMGSSMPTMQIFPGYGDCLNNMLEGVGNFAQGIVPISNTDASYQQTLGIMTGNAGNNFYNQTVGVMKSIGVNATIASQVLSLGQTLGYTALGLRMDICDASLGQGVYVAFQGPINLSTAQQMFTQMAQANSYLDAANINSTLAALMSNESISSVASLIIDVSNSTNPVCEIIFQVLPGDTSTANGVASTLGISWAELSTLSEPMLQTTKPYLISVVLQSNKQTYSALNSTMSVYLPYNMLVSNALLQGTSTEIQSRMNEVAEINNIGTLHMPWFVVSRTFSAATAYSVVTNLN